MRVAGVRGALVALLLTTEGVAAQRIVSGTLLASLDTGTLAGTSFTVSFSYDADQIQPTGETYITLTAFDFTLRGVSFSHSDISQGRQVIFRDGKYENATASFQGGSPPNAPVNNITFGFGGAGIIGYVDRSGSYGAGSFQLSAATAALNAASFVPGEPLAPGALIALFGSGFATTSATAGFVPLPNTLGAVSVTVAGVRAPLQYVSPSQINLQVPWGIPSGPVDIVVTTNGAALAPLQATAASVSPGIFSLAWGAGQAIAVNLDGSLAAPVNASIPGVKTHPASPGDYIIVFATGLGTVVPPVSDGAAGGDILRVASARPSVWIGGVAAQVTFYGLSPTFSGVDQLNVVVPSVPGGIVPLQIESGGIRTTDKVVIAVGNP